MFLKKGASNEAIGKVMKKYILSVALSLITLILLAAPVIARPVGPGGVLNFYDSVYVLLDGKHIYVELSGTSFDKKVTGCVGGCSTRGWVAASTFQASVDDVGAIWDTAYSYYEYR